MMQLDLMHSVLENKSVRVELETSWLPNLPSLESLANMDGIGDGLNDVNDNNDNNNNIECISYIYSSLILYSNTLGPLIVPLWAWTTSSISVHQSVTNT